MKKKTKKNKNKQKVKLVKKSMYSLMFYFVKQMDQVQNI